MFDDFLIWLDNNIRSNDPANVSAAKVRTAFQDVVNTTANNIVMANTGGAIYTLPIEPGSPAISVENTIIPVLTPGTYTNFGGVVLPEGHFGLIFKNGDAYAIETTEMPTAPVNGVVEEGNTQAVSGGEVYTELNGGADIYGNQNLSSYTGNISSGIHTVIMSDFFNKKSEVNVFRCFAFSAGKIKLKTFSVDSNIVTVYTSAEITLTTGLNEIDVSHLGLVIPEGGLFGYNANNADLLGRVGYSSADTKGNYYITITNNNSFVLPTKATTNGIGLNITYTTIGINQKLNDTISKVDMIQSKDLTYSFSSQLGGLNPDYVSNDGYMKLDFTSGNQSVQLTNSLPSNEKRVVSFSAHVLVGDSAILTVGLFSGVNNPPTTNFVIIDNTEKKYNIEVKGSGSAAVAIGLTSINNLGQEILIKDFKIIEPKTIDDLNIRVDFLENKNAKLPQSFNLETALFSLSKVEKKLTKIGVLGDSLMANATGGVIPDIEPIVSERPIRLGESNTISRRLYDLASWNKPTWKRLDNSSWVKSGGWTAINTTNFFEPIYANETYHSANPGAEATVTVPQGAENFALVLRTGVSSGTLDIYLNGVLNQTFDTLKLTAGHTGNPYKTIEILGMPIGQDNVIRIVSESTNTFPIYVWGGFFWSGNTIMVYNVAHGGHTLQNLIDQHIDDEVVDNDFDAILFEHTLMNDTARVVDSGNTIEKSVLALKNILDTKINGKDILTFSCQPYGIDPQDGTPNYYINFPGMEEMKDALKKVSFDYGVPYIDVFDIFKKKIENRNGTLQGGEGGLWYTWDGQHQNKIGMDLYWDSIECLIKNKPLFN